MLGEKNITDSGFVRLHCHFKLDLAGCIKIIDPNCLFNVLT